MAETACAEVSASPSYWRNVARESCDFGDSFRRLTLTLGDGAGPAGQPHHLRG